MTCPPREAAPHSKHLERTASLPEHFWKNLRLLVPLTWGSRVFPECSLILSDTQLDDGKITPSKTGYLGTSLVAQWLRLHAPNAGAPGSIPGQGTKPHMHAATKSSHATTKELESHK